MNLLRAEPLKACPGVGRTTTQVASCMRPPPRSRQHAHSRLLACAAASDPDSAVTSRRNIFLSGGAFLALASSDTPLANAASITISKDVEGFGKHAVEKDDLVLINYTATLASTGEIFDGTEGTGTYMDGGAGVYRPAIIRVGGDPVPGIVAGLLEGVKGMRIGGERTISVPATLGFGNTPVRGPYAFVPAGSDLKYEVKLLRVSNFGPDALTKGILKCGTGGAGEQTEGCRNIEPLEFIV